MAHIGIMGGSFDPVHIGHLITAQSVLEKRNLEKIIFVPCYISPHKVGFNSTEHIHRLEMVKLATSTNPKFEVSDYEIKKGDISFTVDTVEYFKGIYDEIDLIIGFDNLVSFDNWKEPDRIIEMANLVVLKRSNFSASFSLHSYFAKAIFVDTPIIEISSTMIRERVKKNKFFDYFVPKEVAEYIKENKLYTDKKL